MKKACGTRVETCDLRRIPLKTRNNSPCSPADGGTGYQRGWKLFDPPHPNPLPRREGVYGNPVAMLQGIIKFNRGGRKIFRCKASSICRSEPYLAVHGSDCRLKTTPPFGYAQDLDSFGSRPDPPWCAIKTRGRELVERQMNVLRQPLMGTADARTVPRTGLLLAIHRE
jgi:hypothetical protein